VITVINSSISYKRFIAECGIAFRGHLLRVLVLVSILNLAPAYDLFAETERAFDPRRTRSVKITAHIFSGVPDPGWRLRASFCDKL